MACSPVIQGHILSARGAQGAPGSGGQSFRAVGSSSFWIELNFRTQKKCLQAAHYFHACKDLFGEFHAHEAEIGRALDAGKLVWKENSKDCRFYAAREVNPDDESSWPEALSWLCAMSLRLKETALKYGR